MMTLSRPLDDISCAYANEHYYLSMMSHVTLMIEVRLGLHLLAFCKSVHTVDLTVNVRPFVRRRTRTVILAAEKGIENFKGR